MDQLIPSLATLVESFRDCFHPQVFPTFQALLAGWIVCLGPRTLSEVWQATGLAARRHHDNCQWTRIVTRLVNPNCYAA